MSDKDFIDLVRKMRGAQTFYFKSRSLGDLRSARDFERRVDAELKIRAATGRPKQAALI